MYTAATVDSITVNWVPSEVPDLKDYAVWLSPTPNFDPTQMSPSWTGTDLTTTLEDYNQLPHTTFVLLHVMYGKTQFGTIQIRLLRVLLKLKFN